MAQNTYFLSTKSVSNPSAQTNRVLHPNGHRAAGSADIGEVLQRNQGLLGVYFYLFVLMESSGCRIAELLDASHTAITSQGKLLISGKKGSNDRLISDSRATDFLIEMREIQRNPFHGCTRFTARRMLQRVSLFTQKSGRKNLTMTGIFRESYAKEIREINNDDSKVSKLIGHKNLNNGKYYGKG